MRTEPQPPNYPPSVVVREHDRAWRWFVGLALGTEAVFVCYWLAFYPGMMSPDSFYQWAQTQSGQLTNWHPYIHTLWIWLLQLGTKSPATVTLIQLTLSALLYSASSVWFILQGVNRWLVLVTQATMVLLPASGIYNVTLWKDVTAGQFVFALILLWLYFLRRPQPSGVKGAFQIALFVLVTYGASFMRHNHVLLAPAMALLVFLLMPWSLRLRTLYGIALGTLYVAGSIPIWSGAIAKAPVQYWSNGAKLWTLSYAAVNQSPELTKEDQLFVRGLVPNIEISSTCRYFDAVMQSVPQATLTNDRLVIVRIAHLFKDVVLRDPGTVIAQRSCTLVNSLGLQTSRSVYWSDADTAAQGSLVAASLGITGGPKSQWLHRILSRFLTWSTSYPWCYLFWNHAFGVLVVLGMTVEATLKRTPEMIGVASILLVLLVAFSAITTSSDWRYLYYQYVATLLCSPLFRLPGRRGYSPEASGVLSGVAAPTGEGSRETVA